MENISSLLVKKLNLKFPVLCDLGNDVAKTYGLVFTLADSLQPIYSKFGIDLLRTNGDSSHQLPLPATYILDNSGIVTFSFVDVDHTVRLDPDVMLEHVLALG